MKARRITVLLVSVLLMILAGCTGNSTTSSTATPAAASTPTAAQATIAPTAPPQPEEPVTITILMNSGKRVWDDSNEALSVLQENSNTVLDVELSDDLTTQVNMRVASGDLPDIVQTGALTFVDYIDTGYFLEITDLLEQYGPNVIKSVSQQAWDLVKVRDETYAIPHQNNNCKYVYGVRKDWLDTLDITLSNATPLGEFGSSVTLSEYADILRAFTNDDPDGNGTKDTYGLSRWQRNAAQGFMGIYGTFGGQPGQYYDYDGEVLPWVVTDDYRAALSYIAGLWDEGVIDPEYFLLNADQAQQKLMNGVSGTFVGWWSEPHMLIMNGMNDIIPEADWCHIYITSDSGAVTGMQDNGLIDITVMISSGSEHPEAAMKFLDYMATDEGWIIAKYGLEGVHYTLEDGYITRTELGAKMLADLTIDPVYSLISRLEIENKTNLAPVPEGSDPYLFLRSNYNHVVLENTAPLYSSLFYGQAVTTEDTEYGTDVATYIEQMQMEFITGETKLTDESWSAYLSKLDQMGAGKILESYVVQYNGLKGTALKAGQIG